MESLGVLIVNDKISHEEIRRINLSPETMETLSEALQFIGAGDLDTGIQSLATRYMIMCRSLDDFNCKSKVTKN